MPSASVEARQLQQYSVAPLAGVPVLQFKDESASSGVSEPVQEKPYELPWQPCTDESGASQVVSARSYHLGGVVVLFGDGSVIWFHSRRVGPSDPDLYLNNDEQPRPGVHVLDSQWSVPFAIVAQAWPQLPQLLSVLVRS